MQPNNQNYPKEKAVFTTLPDEKILVVKRQHWWVVGSTLIVLAIATLGLTIALLIGFRIFPIFSPLVFILLILTVLVIALAILTKTVVAWYMHLYIVTNRKILEVYYVPIFSYWIKEVLLDQVRCTEIDIRTQGFLNQWLNKGDIIITFDRPTHEEEFTFSDIANPREVGLYLGDVFESQKEAQSQAQPPAIWYRPRPRATAFQVKGSGVI